MSQETNSGNASRGHRRGRLWIAVGAVAALAVVVAVVLVFTLGRGGENGGAGSPNGSGDATQVTSPYDLHELSSDTGPGDVGAASLVSISIPSADGTSKYYGLSSSTAAAKALIEAVAKADEVGAGDIGTTTTQHGESSTQATTGATLTFLFPDRSTLAFDIYVQQNVIARGSRFWRVDGDLSGLVEAAVTAQQNK